MFNSRIFQYFRCENNIFGGGGGGGGIFTCSEIMICETRELMIGHKISFEAEHRNLFHK